ncbi:DUF6884 domain-containing protein [Rhizobium rhizogenes]|nr:DUF6884 domain-containing protein [Rhizobium rhizogenes]NTG63003.1 hypothetical protein [Rhizobium rhizogenes]NTG69511.1 hypothetical protein [Rhizobium rhizogenes]NTG82464.1 hypothetical protein [Rhizobium rhizogenes]NTH27779.1 hypothetical protein [Rhizobium rhizogenes]NTH98206.1 hypothetical protein [Rhizobium rhizogenes]
MRRISLVMCSRSKRPARSAARDLYNSPRYLRDRAAAEATRDDWLILSGKYGLVDPDCVIEPYDFDLNAASPLTKFLLRVRIGTQLLRRVGLTSPLRVELYAEDAYRMCSITALYWLGFRLYPTQGKSGASAILIRTKIVRGE